MINFLDFNLEKQEDVLALVEAQEAGIIFEAIVGEEAFTYLDDLVDFKEVLESWKDFGSIAKISLENVDIGTQKYLNKNKINLEQLLLEIKEGKHSTFLKMRKNLFN